MIKRSRSTSSLVKATKGILKFQRELSKQAQRSLPEQLKAANVLLKRPDPQNRGEWKKHMFIAPAFDNDNLLSKLDYYIFTPSPSQRRSSTKGMPLVVMLHGCQQDSALFAQGSQMNVIAQRNGFVVLYPQQSRHNHINNCWHWHDVVNGPAMAEANTIMRIIRSTVIMHNLDPQKIYVAGLSAGAAIAGILAQKFSEQFAAVAMHSGPVLGRAHSTLSAIKTMRDDRLDSDEALSSYINTLRSHKPLDEGQIPTMIIQGLRDQVVHPRNADELVKQFLYINHLPMNMTGDTTTYFLRSNKEYSQTIYRSGRKRVIELIKVKRLEHAWAGGDTRLPFNSKYGPNSSQLVWEFFKRHLPR